MLAYALGDLALLGQGHPGRDAVRGDRHLPPPEHGPRGPRSKHQQDASNEVRACGGTADEALYPAEQHQPEQPEKERRGVEQGEEIRVTLEVDQAEARDAQVIHEQR